MNIDAIIRETGEVVALGPRGLHLPGNVSHVGLELPDTLSFAEWEGIGQCLNGVEQSIMWWIGDWWNYGEQRRWGKGRDTADKIGVPYQTCADAGWVAKKVQFSRRRENLSWSHHKEVAALPEERADEFLERAAANGWSRNELRKNVSQAKAAVLINSYEPGQDTCTIADLFELVAQGKRFGTVYADPPWLYDNQATRAATGNHYGGMTIDELCELPVRELGADNSHLHLWTTNAFLFECPRIFAAWGYEFRSSFVWVKPQMGIGNYWRNSHEILLTAVRGDAKRFNDHSMKSWLECERSRHSEKPEQVRHFIERASPGPYLELFGRQSATRWTVWGNQIERTLFNHSILEVA